LSSNHITITSRHISLTCQVGTESNSIWWTKLEQCLLLLVPGARYHAGDRGAGGGGGGVGGVGGEGGLGRDSGWGLAPGIASPHKVGGDAISRQSEARAGESLAAADEGVDYYPEVGQCSFTLTHPR